MTGGRWHLDAYACAISTAVYWTPDVFLMFVTTFWLCAQEIKRSLSFERRKKHKKLNNQSKVNLALFKSYVWFRTIIHTASIYFFFFVFRHIFLSSLCLWNKNRIGVWNYIKLCFLITWIACKIESLASFGRDRRCTFLHTVAVQ